MTLSDLVYGRTRRTEPVTAAAAASLGGLDYADAVVVPLPAGTTAVEFCRRSLEATPGWVRSLLAARDRLVRPLGLKAATDLRPGTWWWSAVARWARSGCCRWRRRRCCSATTTST